MSRPARELVRRRQAACAACPQAATCRAQYRVLEPVSPCPTGAHAEADFAHLEAIASRAWPAAAEPVSGCCDRIE